MLEKVKKVINEYNLINENDNIVIGNSGGPDSMFLFTILNKLKDELDFNLFIAHVNHGVRGKEAKADELFVKEISEKFNLPFYSITRSMNDLALGKGISAEEAGREIRYNFFRQVLRELGGGKIGVAHNKNDQAETLLMRFLRGTGIDGLKGMDFISDDIIRPILHIRRDEIEEYLEENRIPYRIDKTNFQSIYLRNKIRLELLPQFEKEYNPNIIETLWRTSRTAAIDSKYLNKLGKERYKALVKKEAKEKILFNRQDFLKEDLSIRQRIIRRALRRLLGDLQGISERHIRLTLDFIEEGNTGKSIDLIDNILVENIYEDFSIQIDKKTKSYDFNIKLDLYKDNEIIINELGYIFNSKIILRDDRKINHNDLYTKYFDYDKIKGDVYIRTRRDGDRIIPFGMTGSKKLKDLFIDKKVAREKRDIIPLILDGSNIMWVVGLATSENYKIDNNTKRILKISFRGIT